MYILGIITTCLYFISGFWLVYNLYHSRIVQGHPHKAILATIIVAAIIHAVFLINTTFTSSGINVTFFNSLSLVSLLIVTLYLLAEVSKPVETLGVLILPTAAISLSLQLVSPSDFSVSNHSPELKIHILLSLLAYGMLSIAAAQSVLLAVQTYYLKRKQPGGFIRSLPPLQSMEILLFQMITIGFVLLSFALLSGFIYLENIFAQHLVHKTVLSIIAWIVFAVLLWGRWHFGWRGKKAIKFTLAGCILLMLAFFGSKMVLELILQKV